MEKSENYLNNSEDPTKLATNLTQMAINSLDETFNVMSISSINRKVLSYTSQYCAALNKDFFLTRIGNLDMQYKNQINMGATPVSDD